MLKDIEKRYVDIMKGFKENIHQALPNKEMNLQPSSNKSTQNR